MAVFFANTGKNGKLFTYVFLGVCAVLSVMSLDCFAEANITFTRIVVKKYTNACNNIWIMPDN